MQSSSAETVLPGSTFPRKKKRPSGFSPSGTTASGSRRNIMTGSSSFSSGFIKGKSTRGPESASRSAGRSSNATAEPSGWRRRPKGGLFSISRSEKRSERDEDQDNRTADRNLAGGRFPRRCPPDEGGAQRGEGAEPSPCRGGRRGSAC